MATPSMVPDSDVPLTRMDSFLGAVRSEPSKLHWPSTTAPNTATVRIADTDKKVKSLFMFLSLLCPAAHSRAECQIQSHTGDSRQRQPDGAGQRRGGRSAGRRADRLRAH